jgi:hypothetical protein
VGAAHRRENRQSVGIDRKVVRVREISFDGGTRVSINLAKPYKGAIKVAVHGGIRATDDASSGGDLSVVIDESPKRMGCVQVAGLVPIHARTAGE